MEEKKKLTITIEFDDENIDMSVEKSDSITFLECLGLTRVIERHFKTVEMKPKEETKQ